MKLIKNMTVLSLFASSLLLGSQGEVSNVAKENIAIFKNKGANQRIYIRSFTIQGNHDITDNHLQNILKPYTKRRYSFSEFEFLKSLIIHEYEKEGYNKAKVYIPEQNTKRDSLTIVVSENKHKKVEITEIKKPSSIKIVIQKNKKVHLTKNSKKVKQVQIKKNHKVKNKPTKIQIRKNRKHERITIEKKQKPLIELGGINNYLPPMNEIKGGKKILIENFKLIDAHSINNKKLLLLLQDHKNKKLNFSQIQNLASIITKEYRDKGYFVARAYIPVQNINSGTLKIAVVEGQYGDFKLSNKSLVKDSLVQGFLDNTKITGTVRTASVDKASLERTMLLINDLPGVEISKANVKPGRVVGTSDFDIVASTKASYDGYLLADNYGGHYTGSDRLMGGININSPFSYGDKLSLSGLISNGEDLINGSISYAAPLNYSGLSSQVSYSDTTYHLSEDLSSLQAQGNSKSIDVKLKYPFLRSRMENLYASVNLSHNRLEDETKSTNDITQKTSDVLSISLDYDKSDVLFNIENQTKLTLSVTAGNLKFRNQDKKDDDKAGANTQGKYSKINVEVSEDMYITNALSVESSFSYQQAFSNKNLDGSEDFSVGGAYGVKLYPSGELNAENGFLFNIEAKYLLSQIYGISNTIGIFYDIGKADMANNTVGFEKRTLQDIGIGYYLNYKNFFTNIQVAWKIDKEEITSEPSSNSKILMLGGMSF